jgi:serine/threonine protein kinase
MEKCDGSLDKLLEEKISFEEEEALEVVHQIGIALDYLERKKVRHMDIKLQNILYKKRFREKVYKLGDFGVSLSNIEPSMCYSK